MTHVFHRRTDQQADPGLDSFSLLALLVGAAAVLVCALPALVIGLVGARLLRGRSWSLLFLLVLAVGGLGLTTVLVLHGLGQLATGQLGEVLREVQVRQWDRARFWTATWPVWLETLPLAPVIAAVCSLASYRRSAGSAALLSQERQRQQAMMRAQRQAARRLRRRLPDTLDGQMVMGVPIDDESNS